MKVLVTGGTGFTGSHLVRRLLGEGHDVHVIDVARGLFFDELQDEGATIELGTIADQAFCEKSIHNAEVIFHLAAAFRQLGVPRKVYRDVNVDGTRHLVDAALRAGVRKFVYCSTQGVHGHIGMPPGDEASPIAPEDYYQYTKYLGEEVVRQAVTTAGLNAVVIRPTAIYGPGDPARFLMLFKMAHTGVFHMFGDGQTTYHPVYVDNLVDALLLAADERDHHGEAYIVGDEHYFTLNDLVQHVGRSMGRSVQIRHWPFWPLWAAAVACEALCMPFRVAPPLFRRRVAWFRQVRAFRIDKARRDLGYQPRIRIEEGLARTATWYRQHGYI
jgi:nucleoside-diphosphate-sugar epimerase